MIPLMDLLRGALLAGLTVAAAAGCRSSSNPVSPGPVVRTSPLAEAATWSLFLVVESCASDNPDISACSQATGRLVEMSLKSAPVAGALSAVLTSRTTLISDVPVLLAGQMQSDGSARYSGSYVSGLATGTLRAIEVQELVATPDERSGLSGTLTVTQRMSSETRTVNARVSSASRQPFPDSPRVFQGTFEGFGTLQSCAGECPNRQSGQRITISLRLTHSGNAVSGDFWAMEVSGTANGNTLTLTGQRRSILDRYGLGTTLSRLESFVAVIDALGRLTGTLTLFNEGVYDSQPGAIVRHTPFTELLTVDLTTVTRQ